MDNPIMLIPHCPKCNGDSMINKLYKKAGDIRNGCYCELCKCGPYQPGTSNEASNNNNTEALAAQFALKLLNK